MPNRFLEVSAWLTAERKKLKRNPDIFIDILRNSLNLKRIFMIATSLSRISYVLFIFLLVSAAGILSPGCIPMSMTMNEQDFNSALQIKTEISRLEEAVKTETNSKSKAKLLFKLALLYSHQRNPEPNYRKALSKLEEFSLLDPEDGKTSFAQYLAALLHRIVEFENKYDKSEAGIKRLKKNINESKQNTEKLRNKYEDLVKENQEIKIIIDKLTHLDIQLEKKRLNIK